jgi:hypothetical protein
MRLHISLRDELIAELDRRVGARGRSAFIAESIRRSLDDEQRWDEIEAAIASIEDRGHEWDADPAGWVRMQRTGDRRRIG